MRRRRAKEREVVQDSKFNNRLVGKFINIVMKQGKKSIAEGIVYGAFEIIKEQSDKQDPLQVFQKAVDNVRPLLGVKSRRVGGATYQVPLDMRREKGVGLALRWIRDFARQKKGGPMQERLAKEILDAYRSEGAAVKKREDMHKMAEANRAFSHFRW